MLSIATVTRGRIGYYLDQTGLGGQTSGLVERDGIFLGSLCEQLGIARTPVEPQALRALFEGVDPTTGEILDPRHHRVRNVAFDCVLAAPKSVSLLHALGTEEVGAEVAAGHDESVVQVLSYLERHAARVRRRGDHDDRVIGCASLGAAGFVHRTSRSDDPHLHTHLLIANLSADDGGRYSALDGRGLYEHVQAAGALYRAQLRQELSTRLGVIWTPGHRGFADLLGLPKSSVATFSRRKAEIENELGESGHRGRRAARVAAMRTRKDKRDDVTYGELQAGWRDRGYSVGIASSTLAKITGAKSGLQPTVDAVSLAEDLANTLDRPFARNELVAMTASAASGGASVSDIEHGVDTALEHAERCADADGVRAFRSRTGGSFPSGVAVERYLSIPALDRVREAQAILAEVPVLEIGAYASTRQFRATLDPGEHQLACSHLDQITSLELARQLARSLAMLGQPVLGLAHDDRTAGHFEAMTGIPTLSPAARGVQLAGVTLFVVDADRHLSSTLLDVHASTALFASVLYLPTSASSAPHVLDDRDVDLRAEHVGDAKVVLCDGPASVVQAVDVLLRHFAQEERDVVVVGTSPRDGMYGPATDPRQARDRPDHARPEVVITVGNVDVLMRSGRSRLGQERVHVGARMIETGVHSDHDAAVALCARGEQERGHRVSLPSLGSVLASSREENNRANNAELPQSTGFRHHQLGPELADIAH